MRLGHLQDVPQDRSEAALEQYDLRTAQEQLGHASQTTTETFYVGLNTEAPKVAETLEKFFKESTPSPKIG